MYIFNISLFKNNYELYIFTASSHSYNNININNIAQNLSQFDFVSYTYTHTIQNKYFKLFKSNIIQKQRHEHETTNCDFISCRYERILFI